MKKRRFFSDIQDKLAIACEISCALLCILGVILSLVHYLRDGYSHWSRRLLYFTAQSNIWLGAVCLFSFISRLYSKHTYDSVLLYVKYSFVVSITMTGVVFCSLLGPLADSSYNAWSLSGIITHVFTPVLGLLSLFLSRSSIRIEKKHCFIALIPPILYFSTTIFLSFFNFDFGRGDNFVYFFLNFNSISSAFGFDFNSNPILIGSIYWLILLFLLMLSIAFFLRYFYNKLYTDKIFKS